MTKFRRIKDPSDLIARTKINENGCMEWQNGLTTKGYACVCYQAKTQTAHRLIWKMINGEIPLDKQINHKCDNRKCINIDHLYLGTQKENIKDQLDRNRHRHSNKKSCKNGHDLSFYVNVGNKRRCRLCHNLSASDFMAVRRKKNANMIPLLASILLIQSEARVRADKI